MPFALYAAQPCVMHEGPPVPACAAIRLATGALAHVCREHLEEMLQGEQSYPVFEVVGAAHRAPPEMPTERKPPLRAPARPRLALVSG